MGYRNLFVMLPHLCVLFSAQCREQPEFTVVGAAFEEREYSGESPTESAYSSENFDSDKVVVARGGYRRVDMTSSLTRGLMLRSGRLSESLKWHTGQSELTILS